MTDKGHYVNNALDGQAYIQANHIAEAIRNREQEWGKVLLLTTIRNVAIIHANH